MVVFTVYLRCDLDDALSLLINCFSWIFIFASGRHTSHDFQFERPNASLFGAVERFASRFIICLSVFTICGC